MEFGFTYKGRHTRAFGVTSRTKSRSLLPETKRYVYDAPAKDGSYDFTEANEFDRAFYKDRVFDMTLMVTASSLIELSRKAAKIAAWLTGAGGVQYIDSPNISLCGIHGGSRDYSDYKDPADVLNRAMWEFDAENEERIDVPSINISGKLIDLSKLSEYGDAMSINGVAVSGKNGNLYVGDKRVLTE